MSTRVVKKRRLKKYAVGDMRERIRIHTRAITAPGLDSASFTETYDEGSKCWSEVTTLDFANSGIDVFDEVNLSSAPTHKFVIRFRSDITTEKIIQWEGDYYKIIKTSNPDGRKEYLEMFSRLEGDKTIEVNK